jgi:hypothetical protein
MGLQKINWIQIDTPNVPTGYTVDIGKTNGPINALYSNNIYLSGISISDLYLNDGSFNNGILTLTSNSGNTIIVSGFTISGDYLSLSGGTINGNLIVTGNTLLNILSATTISGGTFYGDGSNLTNIDNIYTVDGSLQSNRIIDLSGNTLSLKLGSNINDSFLNGIDSSGNTIFELRGTYSTVETPISPSLYFGLNSGKNAIATYANTAFGSNALSTVTTGFRNTAIGDRALMSLINGKFNIAIGENVATSFTGGTGITGDDNIFIGNGVALDKTTGRYNVIIGTNSFQFNKTGDNNTIYGKSAGALNQSGSDNVYIGYRSGRNGTTSSGNVFIGTNSGRLETGSNLLYIDNTDTSTPLIWGDFTNDYLRFNAKVGVNVLNSTYQFDVNGTSRFSNTVQLDTVNLGLNDVKILTLNTGNTIQYRNISDVLNTVTADTYVTGFTYLNNTFTIKDNSGNTFNTTIDVMTGLTVNGDLTVTGNTNLNGLSLNNLSANTISATTISGGTFYGDGSGLTNIKNVYNSDGILTGDRTVDLGGYNFNFTDGILINEMYVGNRLGGDYDTYATIVGNDAALNSDGLEITAIGYEALKAGGGDYNTAIGAYSLNKLENGSRNTAVGHGSLESLTGGSFNTVIGWSALNNNIDGTGNVAIGYRAGYFETGSDKLYIDNDWTTTPLIYGDFANDLLRFNGKVGVNVLPSTFDFDVNGTSRFSNTVQLDTVNSGNTNTKILSLNSNNVVQYLNLSDITGATSSLLSNYLPLSGGTVTGDVIFQSGITASTISGDGSGLTNIQNIYNNDGTLQSNRVVDLSSYTLNFSSSTDPDTFVIKDGKVGIGLTNVTVPFEVRSTAIPSTNEPIARFTVTDAPGAYLDLRNGATTDGTFRAQVVGRQIAGNADTSLSIDGYIDVNQDVSTIQPVVLFRTAKVSGSTLSPLSERTLYDFRNWTTSVMVIDSLGNVGIGVSSPTARLHVNNTGTTNSFLVEDSANPDSSPFVIDDSGSVGIGTTTPQTLLHLNATAIPSTNESILRLTTNDGGGAYLDLNNGSTINNVFVPRIQGRQVSTSTLPGLSIEGVIQDTNDLTSVSPVMQFRVSKTSGGSSLSALTAKPLFRFTNWDVDIISINASGNVGIGTTVPTNKLHVSGSTDPVRFEGLQLSTDTRILTSDSDGVIKYRNLDSITGINTYTTTGITVSSQTLTTSISYYGVSYSGNVNLTLPSPINNDGASIIIKDEGGYSGTYRIRLIPPTGTIDGGSYADMNMNYISLTLIARNNNWWII